MRQGLLRLFLLFLSLGSPRSAYADVCSDIGEGTVTVTGLKGILRGLGGGVGEGLNNQLARFVDDKVDPLLSRADEIMNQRIKQAGAETRATLSELETRM